MGIFLQRDYIFVISYSLKSLHIFWFFLGSFNVILLTLKPRISIVIRSVIKSDSYKKNTFWLIIILAKILLFLKRYFTYLLKLGFYIWVCQPIPTHSKQLVSPLCLIMKTWCSREKIFCANLRASEWFNSLRKKIFVFNWKKCSCCLVEFETHLNGGC